MLRAIIPRPIYFGIRRRFKQYAFAPGVVLHQMRWHASSLTGVAQLTERRLHVAPYFWLFLIGLNNSGTTMLARILASHPLIRAMPKPGGKLTNALPRLTTSKVGRNWTEGVEASRLDEEWTSRVALRVKYDWSYYYPARPGILFEKSPKHTLKASWFQHHFSPARFLAVVRSPYAVSEGIRRRTGITIEQAATHWTRGNERLLSEMRKLDRCLLFSYEKFCAHPAGQLAEIQRFLDLDQPFDDAIVAAPVAAHNIVGAPQRIGNMNARSLGRLSADDIATVTRIAGPLIDHFGYERLTAVP